jgi:hypothetical protein
LRYFMCFRSAFGKSRNFFVVAFKHFCLNHWLSRVVGALLPGSLGGSNWITVTGVWNTILALAHAGDAASEAGLAAKQVGPVSGLCLMFPQLARAPGFQSGTVYAHPLMALCFRPPFAAHAAVWVKKHTAEHFCCQC